MNYTEKTTDDPREGASYSIETDLSEMMSSIETNPSEMQDKSPRRESLTLMV